MYFIHFSRKDFPVSVHDFLFILFRPLVMTMQKQRRGQNKIAEISIEAWEKLVNVETTFAGRIELAATDEYFQRKAGRIIKDVLRGYC